MKILKYNIKLQLTYTLFLLIGLANATVAQDTLRLTLQKVLKIGGANNLTIEAYQEKQALSLAALADAKEWWLPEIYAGVQTQQLWGAAMNADGRFFLDVNRQNLWGGFGLNANWDFADGIYNTKAASLRSQADQYTSQAERNQQLLKIVNDYYDLMVAQLAHKAYQDLVAQSDSIVKQIQLQVENGLRYESELLLAKSKKNRLRVAMLDARKRYNTASAALKRRLNVAQNVELASEDEFLLPLDFTASQPGGEQPSLETATEAALRNRPEIKANELQFQALQTARKKYTTGLLIPELNLGTYGSYFGRINGEVSPMLPAEFPNTQQLYPTGALNISLMWEIPLGELVYEGDRKYAAAKMRLKAIEGEQFKARAGEEIANAISDVQLSRAQIETAREALDMTAEALDQSIKRQNRGTAKPFEVFQAQQFFLQAQLDYLKAVGAFNKAQYALKVAKGEVL